LENNGTAEIERYLGKDYKNNSYREFNLALWSDFINALLPQKGKTSGERSLKELGFDGLEQSPDVGAAGADEKERELSEAYAALFDPNTKTLKPNLTEATLARYEKAIAALADGDSKAYHAQQALKCRIININQRHASALTALTAESTKYLQEKEEGEVRGFIDPVTGQLKPKVEYQTKYNDLEKKIEFSIAALNIQTTKEYLALLSSRDRNIFGVATNKRIFEEAFGTTYDGKNITWVGYFEGMFDDYLDTCLADGELTAEEIADIDNIFYVYDGLVKWGLLDKDEIVSQKVDIEYSIISTFLLDTMNPKKPLPENSEDIYTARVEKYIEAYSATVPEKGIPAQTQEKIVLAIAAAEGLSAENLTAEVKARIIAENKIPPGGHPAREKTDILKDARDDLMERYQSVLATRTDLADPGFIAAQEAYTAVTKSQGNNDAELDKYEEALSVWNPEREFGKQEKKQHLLEATRYRLMNIYEAIGSLGKKYPSDSAGTRNPEYISALQRETERYISLLADPTRNIFGQNSPQELPYKEAVFNQADYNYQSGGKYTYYNMIKNGLNDYITCCLADRAISALEKDNIDKIFEIIYPGFVKFGFLTQAEVVSQQKSIDLRFALDKIMAKDGNTLDNYRTLRTELEKASEEEWGKVCNIEIDKAKPNKDTMLEWLGDNISELEKKQTANRATGTVTAQDWKNAGAVIFTAVVKGVTTEYKQSGSGKYIWHDTGTENYGYSVGISNPTATAVEINGETYTKNADGVFVMGNSSARATAPAAAAVTPPTERVVWKQKASGFAAGTTTIYLKPGKTANFYNYDETGTLLGTLPITNDPAIKLSATSAFTKDGNGTWYRVTVNGKTYYVDDTNDIFESQEGRRKRLAGTSQQTTSPVPAAAVKPAATGAARQAPAPEIISQITLVSGSDPPEYKVYTKTNDGKLKEENGIITEVGFSGKRLENFKFNDITYRFNLISNNYKKEKSSV
ncbi:hypothetical protein NO2_0800, partial [Candidatus Termititenax persephonae]